MPQLPPLALYIHIPWCIRKCPYCDFNSHAVKGDIPEKQYIDALIADLHVEQRAAQGREISSIFIGGGTPSLFSSDAIAEILQRAQQIIPFASGIEITMEANPGTFERQRFAGFKNAGVNRLSIGVQSFNNDHLTRLGRIHSGDEARAAISAANEIGFSHLNIDLMHGLAGQTSQQAMLDIETAIQLEPDHLSWYQLTIEPNTEFHARPPVLPDDESLWQIQEQGQKLIAAAGFKQYEVSAYAKTNAQAQHNLNYWQFGDYIGIGAGAHGKLTLLKESTLGDEQQAFEIIRRWKKRSPKAYLSNIDPLGEQSIINTQELGFEFMMNALRLSQGVDTGLFQAHTGLPIETLQTTLNKAVNAGLLTASDRITPTRKGTLFLNDLLELFI